MVESSAQSLVLSVLSVLVIFVVMVPGQLAQAKRHRTRQLWSGDKGMAKSSVTHRLLDTLDGGRDGLQEIYTEWSKWSRCSKRCKQARSRRCNTPEECGHGVLKEERTCTGRRCRSKPFAVLQMNDDNVFGKNKNKKTDFRVLSSLQSFVYSSWSEWSPCTRRCKTRRVRVCEVPLFCNENIIKQDALCYVEGSACEKMYHRNSKSKKQGQKDSKVKKVKTLPGSMKGLECGKAPLAKGRDLRIIGGRESSPGRWPWQVVLLNRYKEPFCGATILSPNWVLTAAHCVRKRLKVRAGDHILVAKEGWEQQVSVSKSFIHPGYDIDTVDNDVALLKLRRPLKFSDRVQAICLPDTNVRLAAGTLMTILGWGKDKHTKLFGTDTLKEANVPLVTKESCKQVYEDYYISDNMVCAGYKRGKIDSCGGDSGGPLLHKNPKTGQWYIYGITSFGDGCGRKGKYGIYSMVPNYIEWIKQIFMDN